MLRKLFLTIVVLCLSLGLAAQEALTNDSVIKLVKAGLSDDLIVSTINASPGTYDTSADGLIALKTAGVSDKVVSAIVLKASGAASAPAAPVASSPSSSLPHGVDDVGVYLKNKNGTWDAMLPEIVNFKTGGVMKSIASAGIVKGDLNGHIAGAKAKLSTTLPVTFAVYLPEGVEISEYQLLHLRTNNDSREFRSVTGGVMHVSGGATRDAIDFQSQKIGPRVYQIALPSGLGRGEYGLLPPGAYNSQNMGSSGKIYSISVIE